MHRRISPVSIFQALLLAAALGSGLVAQETDSRLHADGKGWGLDQAKIVDTARPRVLLIGDSILTCEINPTIVEHNAMAAKVMAELNIPVNDFYTLLEPKRELMRGDGVHWTPPAYKLLAEAAVAAIEKALAVKPPPFEAVGGKTP